MAAQERVKAFLIDEWANEAVEVQSCGDASVTLALPVSMDLTALVYDLKEDFNANCDLQMGAGGAHVVVHTTKASVITNPLPPPLMWAIVTVAIVSAAITWTTIPMTQMVNATVGGLEFIITQLKYRM